MRVVIQLYVSNTTPLVCNQALIISPALSSNEQRNTEEDWAFTSILAFFQNMSKTSSGYPISDEGRLRAFREKFRASSQLEA